MTPDLDLGDTRLIIKTADRHGLTREQCAYVLATAYHETAHTMNPVVEAYWCSEAWREKNLRYYPWHGRGYVQLTWERNYVKAGKAIGVDLIADPSLAMIPKNAAAILVEGSAQGWFTGKKLADYIDGVNCDFVNARRVINGKDRAGLIAEYAHAYDAALLKSGYGEPKQPGIAAIFTALAQLLVGWKTRNQ